MKVMSRHKFLFLIPCWLLIAGIWLAVDASAQSATAALSGTVVDEKGAAVPDVAVTVTNEATALRRQTSTNAEGYFTAPLLPPGVYTVAALREGFAPVEVRGLELNVNDQRALLITLKVGAVTASTTVEAVEANANKVDITNATVKFSVNNELVRGLPVLTSATGRNTLALLPFLAPGVNPIDTTGTSQGNNVLGDSMSVNGARPNSNSFNFHGSDNNEPEVNRALSPFPNPDALQEFTILTNSYAADEGRSAGGIVNAVTKSGGNQWHGNLRYIGVNEAPGARSFFDREKPINRLHTFGGQLGGPVTIPGLYRGRDRTFFFFDYEGSRSRRGRTFTYAGVLSDKERAGDFSDLPAAQRPRDPLTNQPFPGGLIPANRISPISRAFIDQFLPRPNNGTRGFTTTVVNTFSNNATTARVDQNIGKSDSLNIVLFHNPPESAIGTSVVLPTSFRRHSLQDSWNAALSETHVFAPRLVNQFTAGLGRLTRGWTNTLPGAIGVAPQDFGFTGVKPQTEKYLALPAINLSGTSIRFDPTFGAEETANTTWQIKDDLSYSLGDHNLKFGADARRYIINLSRANNNGSFSFRGVTTARTRNTIADFLLGLPFSFSQNTGATIYPRQTGLFFYGMDDWRARSNLTIQLGLRYELIPPLTDKLAQASVFRPGRKSQRFPNAPAGILFAGDPDPILGVAPSGGYPADKNNFAPRIGLAFSPKAATGWQRGLFGEGKTAIRAAWGVFYDATLGEASTQVKLNQPFSVSHTLTAAQIAAAGGAFADPYGSSPNPFPLDLGRRAFVGPPVIDPFDPDFRTAYTYQYNLTIQRELPGSLLLQLAYVGSNSFKQSRERELNLAVVGPGATPDNVQERRVYPLLGSIPNQESTGRARYDSAQLSVTRRFRNQLSFGGSYTFSKSLDTGTQAIFDFTAGADRWGRSDYDRRHNLTLHYTWSLPKLKLSPLPDLLLNGWELGGITQIRSGLPLAIVQFTDPTLTSGNIAQGVPDLVGPFRRFDPRRTQTLIVNRPESIGGGTEAVTGNFFFDPAAFRAVPIGDPAKARNGNLGRNVFDGPGINQWDLTIIKRVKLAERRHFEFRADISNLFNHALFNQPNTTVDDASLMFGQVTLAAPGRVIQFSLRYGF